MGCGGQQSPQFEPITLQRDACKLVLPGNAELVLLCIWVLGLYVYRVWLLVVILFGEGGVGACVWSLL